MRKLSLTLLLLLIPGLTVYAQQSITLSTYYPSPFGSYSRLRLDPVDSGTVTCDVAAFGTLIIDSNDDILKMCDSTPAWKDIASGGSGGGVWTQNNIDAANAEIYPADQVRTINVGIGTTTPGAKLEVTDEALIDGLTVGQGGGNDATSTAVGYNALSANIVGRGNTAVGYQALYSPTLSGNENTAVGKNTLYTNRGDFNTAVGVSALLSNNTGGRNVAIGWEALAANTTGGRNTATGFAALRFNASGSFNTANGYGALSSNTGSNNTAVGFNALTGNTTGIDNTATGSDTLSNNTTGNDNTATGFNALRFNTTGYYNTATGHMALTNNSTGFANTASGWGALKNNTDHYNTATGYRALFWNTGGDYNTATGNSSLNGNTAGRFNTAHGNEALFKNTTGSFNTANGSASLWNNTIGINNTATGNEALRLNISGNNNTASGYRALYMNSTGNESTAIGYEALYSNTTGINNTALGYRAGYTNTGSGNVFIGYQAGLNELGSNKLYIANSFANPPLIYGDFSTGSVGIGTTTPISPLEIYRDGGKAAYLTLKSTGDTDNYAAIDLHDSESAQNKIWQIAHKRAAGYKNKLMLYYYDGGWNPRMTIDTAGNVGIGTTNPQGTLDVNGSIYQRGGSLHADYVFEDDYSLESITEHAEYMWENKHLKAIPPATVDANGQEIIEYGATNKGVVEELEKAHIYIEQLEKRISDLERKLEGMSQ